MERRAGDALLPACDDILRAVQFSLGRISDVVHSYDFWIWEVPSEIQIATGRVQRLARYSKGRP